MIDETPQKITGEINVSSSTLNIAQKIKNVFDFKEKIAESLTKSITEILEIILSSAITLGASDIHIEPEEKHLKFRIRIDGILQDITTLDLKIFNTLLSRIKLLSGLKLNISDRPQDGRFTVLIEKTVIEVRTSTLPAEYGESIVLRILNSEKLLEIENLGLRDDLIEIFNKEIKRPNGMVIVTGPTGSGKTTTLYAVLKKINKPEIKIITIEDPIEYHLEGISQTQVDPKKGYNFSDGLKSIMRQDPDVILVGEIRDLETAEIACQAALTGHLVFSTLHTNDAAGAMARLIDLGVRPISIAPAINAVIAQRLIRKVCKKCAEFGSPSAEEIKKIKNGLKGVKKKVIRNLINADIKIPRVKGCRDCNSTGYSGRIGIYETFLVDDEMEKFILKSPSVVDMKALATKKGMILMHQDGLIKVLEGTTTIEEVERVTGEE